jgi:hypothetical protein
MKPRVVFIHTVYGLKPLFDETLRRFCPEVDTFHIADETMIHSILAAGGVTPEIQSRLRENVLAADRFGATAIQVTCSTVSACLAGLMPQVKARLLSIDEPMAEEAVRQFQRIGVMATNPATLRPSTELVVEKAKQLGRNVHVEPCLCADAYSALLAGNVAEHDRIVKEHLLKLMAAVDVVLLAQVSMVRIMETLSPAQRRVPVISSPEPAMRRLAAVLKETA